MATEPPPRGQVIRVNQRQARRSDTPFRPKNRVALLLETL